MLYFIYILAQDVLIPLKCSSEPMPLVITKQASLHLSVRKKKYLLHGLVQGLQRITVKSEAVSSYTYTSSHQCIRASLLSSIFFFLNLTMCFIFSVFLMYLKYTGTHLIALKWLFQPQRREYAFIEKNKHIHII